MLAASTFGGPAKLKRELDAIVERTHADELLARVQHLAAGARAA